MMRKCHLNTCPVGIATQDPELRKKFDGSHRVCRQLFSFSWPRKCARSCPGSGSADSDDLDRTIRPARHARGDRALEGAGIGFLAGLLPAEGCRGSRAIPPASSRIMDSRARSITSSSRNPAQPSRSAHRCASSTAYATPTARSARWFPGRDCAPLPGIRAFPTIPCTSPLPERQVRASVRSSHAGSRSSSRVPPTTTSARGCPAAVSWSIPILNRRPDRRTTSSSATR